MAHRPSLLEQQAEMFRAMQLPLAHLGSLYLHNLEQMLDAQWALWRSGNALAARQWRRALAIRDAESLTRFWEGQLEATRTLLAQSGRAAGKTARVAESAAAIGRQLAG